MSFFFTLLATAIKDNSAHLFLFFLINYNYQIFKIRKLLWEKFKNAIYYDIKKE